MIHILPIGWEKASGVSFFPKHDDIIKWKDFPRYWPFVRGIHWPPADSPHKGQWCGALMFSLICARTNAWVNDGDAGDLRRDRARYDVTNETKILLFSTAAPRWITQLFLTTGELHIISRRLNLRRKGRLTITLPLYSRAVVNTLRPKQNGRHSPATFSNAFSRIKMYKFRFHSCSKGSN